MRQSTTLSTSLLWTQHKEFFFGTPHQGLRTKELEAVATCGLIEQLREDAEFLDNQKEELMQICQVFKGKVVSFYETVMTPSVGKVSTVAIFLCPELTSCGHSQNQVN